jgi:hypothetical protein
MPSDLWQSLSYQSHLQEQPKEIVVSSAAKIEKKIQICMFIKKSCIFALSMEIVMADAT